MQRFLTLLLFSLTATSGYCQTNKTASPFDQIFKFALVDRDYSFSRRVELAAMYAAYCRSVLNAIPTNTPTEQAWVSEEGRTTDMKRITRLVQSKEYARYQLKETFTTCLDRVVTITEAQKRNDRTFEAAAFISAALNFNQSTDLASYANRVGLTSDEFQFSMLGSLREALMIAALRTLDGK